MPQEITQSRNMGRKTTIVFNLRKMTKIIATARRECRAKHENKANCNTVYLVPDLIDFFGDQ